MNPCADRKLNKPLARNAKIFFAETIKIQINVTDQVM